VDYDHRSPGVEEVVCDDSSDRRAADHIVSIDVAAEDTVVEVVGHAVIVNRTDVVRNRHVMTEVVVVRVHIRSGFGSGARSSGIPMDLRCRLRTSLSMLVVTSLGVITG